MRYDVGSYEKSNVVHIPTKHLIKMPNIKIL
jgi:hypothetical protein